MTERTQVTFTVPLPGRDTPAIGRPRVVYSDAALEQLAAKLVGKPILIPTLGGTPTSDTVGHVTAAHVEDGTVRCTALVDAAIADVAAYSPSVSGKMRNVDGQWNVESVNHANIHAEPPKPEEPA